MYDDDGNKIQQITFSQRVKNGFRLITYDLPDPCSIKDIAAILDHGDQCERFCFNDFYVTEEFTEDENKYISREWMDERAAEYFAMFPKSPLEETYRRLLKNLLIDEENDKEQIVDRYATVCGIRRMLKQTGIFESETV